jgi:type I restriction enzyme, S subunit
MSEQVPEGWDSKNLNELVIKHNSGVYKKSDFYGSGSNIIGVSQLYQCEFIKGQQFKKVPLDDTEIAKFTLYYGDLLYGESSLVRSGIAKTVCVTPDGEGTAFAWHTRRFSVDQKIVYPEFLNYFMAGPKVRNYLEKVCTQTALTGITTVDYFGAPITLPPLPEQKKIASILTSVDEVIEKTQSQIDKLQDLKKGTMNELLTKGIGHTEFKDSELGRIPKSWEVGIVSDLGKVVTGSTPNTTNRELYDGEFMFVSPSDISEEMFVEGTDKTVTLEGLKTIREIPLNSVMIVCIGSTIGKVALTTDRCATNQQINTIVPENADPFFIYFLMKMMANLIRKESGTQAVPLINKTDFSNIMIKKPPIDEQRVIGRYLSSFNSAILKKTNKLHQIQSLKKSLMQDLLTGKVRVSVN